MVTLNAHFDGKTIVFDEPLSMPLQTGARLKVIVQTAEEATGIKSALNPPHTPKAGSAKGKVAISADFDSPLDDFSEYTK